MFSRYAPPFVSRDPNPECNTPMIMVSWDYVLKEHVNIATSTRAYAVYFPPEIPEEHKIAHQSDIINEIETGEMVILEDEVRSIESLDLINVSDGGDKIHIDARPERINLGITVRTLDNLMWTQFYGFEPLVFYYNREPIFLYIPDSFTESTTHKRVQFARDYISSKNITFTAETLIILPY